jgi:predicted phosphodiesterase
MPFQPEYRDVIVSDVHAGHPGATGNIGKFGAFLGAHPSERLVLLGDIHDLHQRRLFPAYFKYDEDNLVSFGVDEVDFLSIIHRIPGNHDPREPWTWETLWRVPVKPRDILRGDGWVAVHGHAEDILWRLGELSARFLPAPRKGLGPRMVALRTWLLEKTGFFRRLAALGKREGVRVVIHGHGHAPGIRQVDGVTLICLPDWVDHGGGGLLIDKNGRMVLVDADGKVIAQLARMPQAQAA